MSGPASGADPTAADGSAGGVARRTRRSFVPTASVAVVAAAAGWWTEGLGLRGRSVPVGARRGGAMVVVLVVVGLALLGRRRAERALGPDVAPRRSKPRVTRAVVAGYALVAASVATTFVVVDAAGVVPAAWHAAAVALAVVALSTVGVWTVVLDGSVPAIAVGRVVPVFPVAVLGVGAGLGAGYVTFFPAIFVAGLLASGGSGELLDQALWTLVWFAGVWAGTFVSTWPIWSGAVHGHGPSGQHREMAADR